MTKHISGLSRRELRHEFKHCFKGYTKLKVVAGCGIKEKMRFACYNRVGLFFWKLLNGFYRIKLK